MNLSAAGRGRIGEQWRVEDGPTLAAAVGEYCRGHDSRRVPSLLALLYYVPDFVRPQQVAYLVAVTSGVLQARIAPLQGTMPPLVQQHVGCLVQSRELACMLLHEFRHPSTCQRCKGHGQILRVEDEAGNAVAPVIAVCPVCHGVALVPRGPRYRAKRAGLGAETWTKHLQPVFDRTLHGYRYLADLATLGILRKLG
jgi:hypothetical protein